MQSSTETEYKTVNHTTYKMIWIQILWSEIGVAFSRSMVMVAFNNQAAIYIANNLVFHDRQSILRFTIILFKTCS